MVVQAAPNPPVRLFGARLQVDREARLFIVVVLAGRSGAGVRPDVRPDPAPVGREVVITGTGLANAQRVTFGASRPPA